MNKEREQADALDTDRAINAAEAGADPERGMMARKIISLAGKNGVPVHEDQNLIEVLSTIDLPEDMPAELFKAVAEVLAFTRAASKQP